MITDLLKFIVELSKLLTIKLAMINVIAIILSPIIAVAVGEMLRKRNYNKQQRDDLIRRIISYGYQMSSTYHSGKNEILCALNEIKYWYSQNLSIKNLIFEVIDKMERGEDAQDLFILLVQVIAQKEGHRLSRQEIEKVFTTRN